MKKIFIFAFLLIASINYLSAQKIEETRTYKQNGDIVSVMVSKYDVEITAGSSSTDPLAVMILRDKYGAQLGKSYFYASGNKSISKASTKSDRVGFELHYSYEVFEAIADLMEGNNAILEFNTKSKKASLKFGASSNASANRGGTNNSGVNRGATGNSKVGTSKIKLQNGGLQPAGSKIKRAPK